MNIEVSLHAVRIRSRHIPLDVCAINGVYTDWYFSFASPRYIPREVTKPPPSPTGSSSLCYCVLRRLLYGMFTTYRHNRFRRPGSCKVTIYLSSVDLPYPSQLPVPTPCRNLSLINDLSR